jgi:hypothetical protein
MINHAENSGPLEDDDNFHAVTFFCPREGQHLPGNSLDNLKENNYDEENILVSTILLLAILPACSAPIGAVQQAAEILAMPERLDPETSETDLKPVAA